MKFLFLSAILLFSGCATRRVFTAKDYKRTYNSMNIPLVTVIYELDKCPSNWNFPEVVKIYPKAVNSWYGKYSEIKDKKGVVDLEYGEYRKSFDRFDQIKRFTKIKTVANKNKCSLQTKVGFDYLLNMEGNIFATDLNHYKCKENYNLPKCMEKRKRSYNYLDTLITNLASINKIKITKRREIEGVEIIPMASTVFEFSPSMDDKKGVKQAYYNMAMTNYAWGLSGECGNSNQCNVSDKKKEKQVELTEEEKKLQTKFYNLTRNVFSPYNIQSYIMKQLDNPKDQKLLKDAYKKVVTPSFINHRWAQFSNPSRKLDKKETEAFRKITKKFVNDMHFYENYKPVRLGVLNLVHLVAKEINLPSRRPSSSIITTEMNIMAYVDLDTRFKIYSKTSLKETKDYFKSRLNPSSQKLNTRLSVILTNYYKEAYNRLKKWFDRNKA